MSNSNSNSVPHAHLIGAKVTIIDEVKNSLKIAWSEGVIAAVGDTPQGVGIHVCNPETGDITDAITLAGVKLHESAVALLKTTGEMNASVLGQIASALGDGAFG